MARIVVNTANLLSVKHNKAGRVRIDIGDSGISVILTHGEALRLADSLVDSVESHPNKFRL